MTTPLAFMNDHIFSRLYFNIFWLHESATQSRSVSRVNINMLAPQTIRTMVGIAIAPHFPTTVPTCEIFDIALKSPCLHSPHLTPSMGLCQ